MKHKYNLLQGKFTSMGTGDYIDFGTFKTFKAAKEEFNRIKSDVKGYCLGKDDLVETILIRDDDLDDVLLHHIATAKYR